ncbi:MAG TPA: hypothetical protein VME46_21350, partial [Acidimicrobiales bacterium]|nr:hypothetical protein [Acidimicrobiales bacterium]
MSGTLTVEPSISQPVTFSPAQTYRRRFGLTSPRKAVVKVAAYGVLVLVGIFFIAPLVWLLLASFEPNAAVGENVPLELSFSNFGKVLNWSTTFLPLINS